MTLRHVRVGARARAYTRALAPAAGILLLCACQEYGLRDPPVVPPAEPPGAVAGEFGSPPDWQDCFEGFLGTYSNLSVDHPDVEPGPDAPAPDDPLALDWWDEVAFERYDPGLDFGSNWWPVDDGLEADPAYFSARWIAWIRVWDDTDLTFTLGSADDSWVIVDGETIASLPGIRPFAPETFTVRLESGQYPMEVRYAHRAANNGFRFRVLSGDVSICYPEFDEEE